MNEKFPGTGRRYLLDFKAFRVKLYFKSETSLTYTGVKPTTRKAAPKPWRLWSNRSATSSFW